MGLLVLYLKPFSVLFQDQYTCFDAFCIVLDKSEEINKINIFQSLLSFLISLVKEQKTRSYLEACNESFYMNIFNFNRRSNMEFLFTFKKEKHWFRRFYSDCMKWSKIIQLYNLKLNFKMTGICFIWCTLTNIGILRCLCQLTGTIRYFIFIGMFDLFWISVIFIKN